MQVTLNSHSGGSMESGVWEDMPGLRENLKPFYFRQERMVVRVTKGGKARSISARAAGFQSKPAPLWKHQCLKATADSHTEMSKACV